MGITTKLTQSESLYQSQMKSVSGLSLTRCDPCPRDGRVDCVHRSRVRPDLDLGQGGHQLGPRLVLTVLVALQDTTEVLLQVLLRKPKG